MGISLRLTESDTIFTVIQYIYEKPAIYLFTLGFNTSLFKILFLGISEFVVNKNNLSYPNVFNITLKIKKYDYVFLRIKGFQFCVGTLARIPISCHNE